MDGVVAEAPLDVQQTVNWRNGLNGDGNCVNGNGKRVNGTAKA